MDSEENRSYLLGLLLFASATTLSISLACLASDQKEIYAAGVSALSTLIGASWALAAAWIAFGSVQRQLTEMRKQSAAVALQSMLVQQEKIIDYFNLMLAFRTQIEKEVFTIVDKAIVRGKIAKTQRVHLANIIENYLERSFKCEALSVFDLTIVDKIKSVRAKLGQLEKNIKNTLIFNTQDAVEWRRRFEEAHDDIGNVNDLVSIENRRINDFVRDLRKRIHPGQ